MGLGGMLGVVEGSGLPGPLGQPGCRRQCPGGGAAAGGNI